MPDYILAQKGPDGQQYYTLDLSAMLPSDLLLAATLSSKPSGDGELVLSEAQVIDTSVVVLCSEGIAGRVYDIRVVGTALSGAVIDTNFVLPIDRTLAPYPYVAPPEAGFGDDVVVTWAPAMVFSNTWNTMLLPLV